MTTDKALKLALEALEDERYVSRYSHISEAITAIKEALAQPPLPVQPERQPVNEAAIRADEREACAKVAEKSWQEFRDTKDAHERLSPAPFKLEKFGFNQSTIQQSQIIADNIRARGQA